MIFMILIYMKIFTKLNTLNKMLNEHKLTYIYLKQNIKYE